MNKPRMIDCDAAAALMEPLTDLVMQAGVAILAVNRKFRTFRRCRRSVYIWQRKKSWKWLAGFTD